MSVSVTSAVTCNYFFT